MNPLLKLLMHRLQAPAGDGGSDMGGTGSGAEDRGDDFVATEGDEPAAAPAPAPKDEAPADEDDIDPEDPDADPKAEDKDKKDDEPKKKDSRIPLSRHKDLLEKERAKRADLEQKLAQYQQGTQVATLNESITAAEGEILKLEKDYATMLADGEVEKATALMAKIRGLERQMSEAKSDMKIAAAEARATERARYNIVLERIESAYPELNPDSDSYDEDMMQDVADLKASYESRRNLTPTAAMQKAVEKLLGTRTKAQEKVIDTTPRVSEKDVAKEKAAERKKEAVARTAEAVGKQPPSTAKAGMDSDKAGGSLNAKDIMKMSQADFAKLSEADLARMRGDEVN